LESDAKGFVVGAATFAGVDQTAPLGAVVSDSGTSANPSVAVTATTTDLVFAAVAFKNGGALNPATGQTQLWSGVGSVVAVRGAGSTATGVTNITMSWTQPSGSSASWATAGIATHAAPSADVAATMTGPASVVPGANAIYTIAITNQGPFATTNVVVTNILPAGTTFVSASNGGASSNGGVLWNLGTLAANANTNVSLTLKAPNVAGLITNTISSASSTLDLVPSNNDGSSATARVITLVNTAPVPTSPTDYALAIGRS
jgi:uncharacterized repeat protein (TIGR01451 family)